MVTTKKQPGMNERLGGGGRGAKREKACVNMARRFARNRSTIFQIKKNKSTKQKRAHAWNGTENCSASTAPRKYSPRLPSIGDSSNV